MRNKLIPYNPALKELARKLRKEGTLGEALLWKQIKTRSLGVEFHRQVPINNFIVDFYCHELMLAIEIDGSSHIDADKDNERQSRLEALGVRFLRFTERTVRHDMNSVVIELIGVIEKLKQD